MMVTNKKNIKLSVVMPMYNSINIKRNLDAALNSLEKVTRDYELILVNDGSLNGCYEEALDFKNSKLKVVGYVNNQGKGNAVKYGFGFARGEFIAFIDVDGDIDPVYLKNFIKISEKNNADVVIGSKRHPGSLINYSVPRKIMSLAYQLLNAILFNLNVKDTQVGIKLFKREALRSAIPKMEIKGFAFDLELLIILKNKGYRIEEAPIVIRRKMGSTINPKLILFMLFDTIKIFYKDRILREYD